VEPASTRPTRPVTQVERVRGTQSLLQIVVKCWRCPGLLARELAWRWLFGIPALAVLFYCTQRLLAILFASHTDFEEFSLQQPAAAAQIVRASYVLIAPAALRSAIWIAPLLMIGWAIASGVGRASVLRALAPESRFRPWSLALLQLLRIAALALSFIAWLAMVRAAAVHYITGVPTGTEPSTVAFAAWLICLSLGSFTLWALWSWFLSIASVLIVSENRSLLSAVVSSLRLGPLTMQLVEVNLVLGIVKLAVIVLAMVFSAIPLPFETVMTGRALYIWWAAVGVWYLAASDFFQVARLAAFLEFWRRSRPVQPLGC
jgi:hypothetical protein